MAYATVADVAARLGYPLDAAESTRVGALLEDVSALVDGYCRRTFPDPVPPDVKAIVISETIRLMNQNPGVVSEKVGDVQMEFSSTSGSLSRTAKESLRGYRVRVASWQVRSTTWAGDS